MKKTVVIYGSSTGTCEGIAKMIGSKLGLENSSVVDVSKLSDDVIAQNDNLILGTSTWGIGELQDDWIEGLEKLKSMDLSGKTIAIFGCGDSDSYSESFCGAMIELWNGIKSKDVNLIGEVSIDGYTFDDSESVIDGRFVGLALDEVNEDDKTEARIDSWIAQIKSQL